MSANLLDGVKPNLHYPNHPTESDGVIAFTAMPDGWYNIASWTLDEPTLTENQIVHLGISVKWHDAAATAGNAYASVRYADAAGNYNAIDVLVDGITTEWQRFSLYTVVPSGMHIVDFHISAKNLDAAYDATNPTLSYGSPVTLAISSTTLAWSAGIVATTRYYKLASATSSTPAVPTSSSALNGWSETEPTADVTKVMWVCERTVYADGTESWSKASKSTSYEAAKDAKSAANAAASTADSAKSAADRAQSTADAALDNAGTANGRVRAVEAKFSASIDGLDVRVRGVSEAVSAQGATVRDVERNMSFGLDGLVIGAADSASKVRITEKRETFEVDGKTVLALDGDTSTVEASALKIGGYVWTATNGGKNLTLVYRG